MVSNCQLSTPLPEGKHLMIKRQLYRGPFTLREVAFFSFSIDSKCGMHFLICICTQLHWMQTLIYAFRKLSHTPWKPSILFLYHKWSKGGHKPGNNATLQVTMLPCKLQCIYHWQLMTSPIAGHCMDDIIVLVQLMHTPFLWVLWPHPVCIQGQLTSSCSLECPFWYTKLPGATYYCIKKALFLKCQRSEANNRAVCGSNLGFVCNAHECNLQWHTCMINKVEIK